MVSASQIKEQLARFLNGEIDLDVFEDWFVQSTWNIHQSGSAAAEDLTFAVEESLAEYSSRHIDEQKLRSELSQILEAETRSVDIVDAPQTVYSFRSSAPSVFVPVKG